MLGSVYRSFTALAAPALPLVLARRTRAGKEDPTRRAERFGVADLPRPDGPLVWVHGASVGESLSVQPLIRALLAADPTARVLMTTGTVTSAKLMAERLPDRAFHQFVPLDRAVFARRFLDHWRPDLVIWMESEIWPNLLDEVRRRGTPAALVNARMSERSFRNWSRFPRFARRLVSTFSVVLPSDTQAAAHFSALGADSVGPPGNLKFSVDPPPVDAGALAALRDALAGRPVWLAASTHDGEETDCLTAHARFRQRFCDGLALIAPRHPTRGQAVADLAQAAGVLACRRSVGALPTAGHSIYIADTLGEMGTLLAACPMAFVGGSLVPHGGHNPIEPAQLGAAILFGPHMESFADIARELTDAGAARVVVNSEDLAERLAGWQADPLDRQAAVDAATALAERHRGRVDAVMGALSPLLDRAGWGKAA